MTNNYPNTCPGGGQSKDRNNYLPIAAPFDNNYVIPAGIAFYSLLKNSNPDYVYKIYIISGSEITPDNKKLLSETLKSFKNIQLEYINMESKFSDLFTNTKEKQHFSKEIYYKLIIPSLFPNLDKILVTDVDVIFMNDISQIYNSFNIEEDYYLYASKGIYKENHKSKSDEKFKAKVKKTYSTEELKKLAWAGGFYVYNLKKMRENNIEEKLLQTIKENSHRFLQPEQDTLNITCYPKIKTMPANALVCSYAYDMFQSEEDYNNSKNYFSKEEISFALNNPIQLHYAGNYKPWNSYCAKSEIWYDYIKETPLNDTFMKTIFNMIDKNKYKTVCSFKIPFYKKKFYLIKT